MKNTLRQGSPASKHQKHGKKIMIEIYFKEMYTLNRRENFHRIYPSENAPAANSIIDSQNDDDFK
jgi:hypothetical protein